MIADTMQIQIQISNLGEQLQKPVDLSRRTIVV